MVICGVWPLDISIAYCRYYKDNPSFDNIKVAYIWFNDKQHDWVPMSNVKLLVGSSLSRGYTQKSTTWWVVSAFDILEPESLEDLNIGLLIFHNHWLVARLKRLKFEKLTDSGEVTSIRKLKRERRDWFRTNWICNDMWKRICINSW